MSKDLGWSNVGFHNDRVHTPAIDALRRDGIEFTRHYAYKFCSPSRSSFLSGRLPVHVNEHNKITEAPLAGVHPNMTMLPAKLKEAGYATHHLGKWHAGFASRSTNIPTSRGFDTSLAYFHGAEDHYLQICGGNIKCPGHPTFADFWLNDAPATGLNGTDYSLHIYAKRALQIIDEHDASIPLFLYFAFDNNHAPLEVPKKYMNSYRPASLYAREWRLYQGMITAVDVGETEITASHGDVSASALVTVIESRIRGVPEPGIILSVVDVDTPGGFSILHEGGLTNGANGFHDRDGQTWDVVPAKLIGADYIETSQNNADVTDDRGTTLELAVEVVDGAILHMFIDNRIPAGQLPFPWMNEKVFGVEWFDTGEDVETSYVVQGFSVWSTIDPLEEGVYTFRQQPVDAGFYGIAATAFLEDRPREFHRGDTNDDGDVNLSDAVHVLNWLFLQGDAPTCVDAADVDDDGNVLLTDAVSLLNFLFLQGVPPADPGPPPNECGTDDTAPLGCEAYGSC